jgi:hypothetical protein
MLHGASQYWKSVSLPVKGQRLTTYASFPKQVDTLEPREQRDPSDAVLLRTAAATSRYANVPARVDARLFKICNLSYGAREVDTNNSHTRILLAKVP